MNNFQPLTPIQEIIKNSLVQEGIKVNWDSLPIHKNSLPFDCNHKAYQVSRFGLTLDMPKITYKHNDGNICFISESLFNQLQNNPEKTFLDHYTYIFDNKMYMFSRKDQREHKIFQGIDDTSYTGLWNGDYYDEIAGAILTSVFCKVLDEYCKNNFEHSNMPEESIKLLNIYHEIMDKIKAL